MVRAGILVRELEGETLVLDTVADRIHRLNALAAEIWRLHEAGAAPAQIAVRLATRYDVGEESAYEDVTRTVEQFRVLGLID